MFIYSSGDPTTNPFNEFLKAYGIYLAIGVAGIILLFVLFFVIFGLTKRNKKPVEEVPQIDNSGVLLALGGKDNVLSHSLNGSRIAVELKDYSLVDDKKLNELGVASVIKMSNKITLVIKGDSTSFYNSVFKSSEL